MYRYLVIGLESTGTRVVSKLLALNLNIISHESEWDAVDEINDGVNSVTHRSMPHGIKGDDRFIPSVGYIETFDRIIITTRDINVVKISKLKHDSDADSILIDNDICTAILRAVMNTKMCHIFSYESAVMLQDSYIENFFHAMGIRAGKYIEFSNENKKYIAE